MSPSAGPSTRRRVARLLPALLAATLAACALQAPRPPGPPALAGYAGGRAPIARTGGDLASARRCIDDLLVDQGSRGMTLIVEDLNDPATTAATGTREMLVAVLADLTQRSRAIRLLASDQDWRRTAALRQPQVGETATAQPQYALRGTLRALDASGAPRTDVAAAQSGAAEIALDLMLLSTHDMAVVAGTASHNVVSVRPAEGRGDGWAEMYKLGTQFIWPLPAGGGRTAATRAVLEMAAIELVGRLAKVPYWTCFGAAADEAPVAAEIQDWYDAMAARPAEIIRFFQQQLTTRRAYDGPVDGQINPAFKDAVARYREALGLSREPKLSLDLFKAYLAADHVQVRTRLATPATVPAPSSPATAATPVSPAASAARPSTEPLSLRIAGADDAHRYASGEAIRLKIEPNRDAHVYCFHQDENRKVVRFFPNRFQPDSRVAAATGLQLPGTMRFEMVMNGRGVPEGVACFATPADVLSQLPAAMSGDDFSRLPVATLDQLRSAFARAAGGNVAQASLQLRPR